MTESKKRQQIVEIGRFLHNKGFIVATDGNISVRLDGDSILITPTGMSKGMLHANDLIRIDSSGRKVVGSRNASRELGMHMMIYRMRADVNAVVHAHPSTATGFAAAGIALDEHLLSEVELSLQCVPLAPYALPASSQLCDVLKPFIPDHNAILMANHGVVTYGEDLLTAYMHMETVEHYAQIALVTRQLGQRHLLDAEQVCQLQELSGKSIRRGRVATPSTGDLA